MPFWKNFHLVQFAPDDLKKLSNKECIIAVGKESLLEAQQGVKTRIDNLIDINISREVQSIQQWGDKYIAGAADKLNQINAAAEAEYQMGYMLQEKRSPRNWFLCQANNPTAHTGSGTF